MEIAPLIITLKTAVAATIVTFLAGTGLALAVARMRRFQGLADAVITLPLVLPPTVLGFYLLVLLGPNGPGGALTQAFGLGLLPFTFGGLVVASMVYSLPFVVQPLQQAFAAIGRQPLEAAASRIRW